MRVLTDDMNSAPKVGNLIASDSYISCCHFPRGLDYRVYPTTGAIDILVSQMAPIKPDLWGWHNSDSAWQCIIAYYTTSHNHVHVFLCPVTSAHAKSKYEISAVAKEYLHAVYTVYSNTVT